MVNFIAKTEVKNNSIVFPRFRNLYTKLFLHGINFSSFKMLRIFFMHLTSARYSSHDATSKEFLEEGKLDNQVCEGRTFICYRHYSWNCSEYNFVSKKGSKKMTKILFSQVFKTDPNNARFLSSMTNQVSR